MPLALQAIRPKKFKQLDPTRTTANVRRSMRRYLQIVAKDMAVYPAKANPGGYQRTRQLMEGWLNAEISVSADGGEGILINRVPWATVAQGPRGGGRGPGARQSQLMRKLGWQSITDVTRKRAKLYQQIMNRAVQGRTTF